jgi:hypothetical protein
VHVGIPELAIEAAMEIRVAVRARITASDLHVEDQFLVALVTTKTRLLNHGPAGSSQEFAEAYQTPFATSRGDVGLADVGLGGKQMRGHGTRTGDIFVGMKLRWWPDIPNNGKRFVAFLASSFLPL